MSNLRSIVRRSLIILAVVFLAIQLVPVDRSNPPVESEVDAPADVLPVLRRACYDCHSHQTRWPWYGYVAPASWLMAWDVDEARGEMNFSVWNRLDPQHRAELIGDIWEEVEEDEMPLWYYRPLHPEARLSAAERDALRRWAASVDGGRGGHGENEDEED